MAVDGLSDADLKAAAVADHDILEEFGSRDIPNLVSGLDWRAVKKIYDADLAIIRALPPDPGRFLRQLLVEQRDKSAHQGLRAFLRRHLRIFLQLDHRP